VILSAAILCDLVKVTRRQVASRGGSAVRIPTISIPTVLSSYSRIAGLGWEPGYAVTVSYVSREAGKSRNYFPNMRCVQAAR